jgi:demethylmenaquinone methyltransferase/2-methoxy-6-polyprenyl-1,4-benzoquinol methylase
MSDNHSPFYADGGELQLLDFPVCRLDLAMAPSSTGPEFDRVERSHEQARASYNRISRFYDLLAGWSERKDRDTGLARLAAKEGEQVLEVGFGTGLALTALARAVGKTGKVCGLDLSEAMVSLARNRLERAGLAERAELKVGDALALPYANRSFDAVFMSFVLELFDTPEIPLVLAECRRVLRPEGRIGIVSISASGPLTLVRRLYEWSHRRFPRVVDCRPIPVRALVESAGFSPTTTETTSMWGLGVEIVAANSPAQSV